MEKQYYAPYKIKTITIVLIGLLILGGILLINYLSQEEEEDKKLFSVSKFVRVSENIIEGYEDKDYIPRSVSINKKRSNE